MDKSSLLSAFNNHFGEFAEDIANYFPENMDIKTSINACYAIRKVNPALIIKVWKGSVVNPYKKQIDDGDFEFFINKDYSEDINIDQKDRALQVIEKLRVLIPKMAKEDQDKCMQYVKNLTTLSIHYFNA
jgi:hypothetical protein